MPRLIPAAVDLSKNPLVIALVAALLGNFLIPRILDRAETNRRALDLKAKLATQMGGSVEAVLSQGDLFARGVIKKTNLDPQAAFNEALRDWRIASAEVDAQLTAYFGADRAGRALTERWRHFKVAVDGMYFLSGTGLKGARCRMIREVTIVLESRRTRCNAGALERETYQERMCLAKKATMYVRLAACDSDNADVYGYRRDGRFSSVYEELSGRLLGRSRSLVKELVGLNPSGF